LLGITAAPALAASEIDFEIRNRTETTVSLILRGPTDMTVSVRPGNKTLRLLPGLYSYRYFACGHNNSGTFTFSGAGHFLVLRKCEKGINSTVTIVNKTGHTFSLDMFGSTHYALTIKPGDNKLTLVAGVYQYSTDACGFPIQKGTAKLKSGLNNDWVFDCD
jgi:hypothetical protein